MGPVRRVANVEVMVMSDLEPLVWHLIMVHHRELGISGDIANNGRTALQCGDRTLFCNHAEPVPGGSRVLGLYHSHTSSIADTGQAVLIPRT